MKKDYLTTSEAAKELGISRIAVFKKIKSGEIQADKFGRGFAIPRSEIFPENRLLSENDKKSIEESVKRTVKEYGGALKMLGKE